jgi:putative redox protein
MVDQIEMEISFAGNLSGEQQQRLLEIAQRCPVHRMLVSPVVVHTRLLASASRPA